MDLLAPRPLRMPHPRTHSTSPGSDFKSSVITGPGWQDTKIQGCGFGTLCVPEKAGTLTMEIRSCNISGSVALWSDIGIISRVFLNRGEDSVMKASVSEGVGKLYLVPDRIEQIIEMENVTYE